MQVAALQNLGVPMAGSENVQSRKISVTDAQSEPLLALEAEERQKLWRWIVFGALIFLVAETWFAGIRAAGLNPSKGTPS